MIFTARKKRKRNIISLDVTSEVRTKLVVLAAQLTVLTSRRVTLTEVMKAGINKLYNMTIEEVMQCL